MKKRARSGLIWLGLIFAGGVVAVAAIGMIASRRDSAAVQRIRERGELMVARYERQFAGGPAAAEAPAEADAPGEGGQSGKAMTAAGQEPPAFSSAALALFERLKEGVELANSAPVHTDIRDLIEHKPPSEWTEADLRLVAEFLGAHAELIEEIRRLARLGEPVYQVDLSMGCATELPHLAPLRAMARLLQMEAAFRAQSGDIDGAMEDFRAILGLSDTLVEEPLVISQLVRIAMLTAMYDGLGSSLSPGQLDPRDARAFVQELAGMYYCETMANALITEAAFGMAAMEDMRNGASALVPDPASSITSLAGDSNFSNILGFVYQTPIGDVMLSADRQSYAEYMERLAQAANAPYYEVQGELAAIDAEVGDESIFSVCTQILVPALTRVQRAQARGEAMIDLTRIGLALEACHAETGAYPENLNAVATDLGGAVPVDPFTGQGYVYLPQGGSFILYSLGENGRDDGGRHDLREGDIVWRGREQQADP